MTFSRSWVLTIAITAVVVLWMISGVIFSSREINQHPPAANKPPPKVRVQQSVAQTMTNRLILQGQTVADRTVTIKAETHGVVKRALIDKGVAVKAGESLFQLALEDRQERLQQARSQLAEQKTEYQAVQSLKKSGFQAEMELARAKAGLDAAAAALRQAQLELQHTNITAPIDAIADKRLVEVGDFVNRGDPVATLVDLDPIRVVAQVSERYLGQIKPDSPGEVRLLDGDTIAAKITYVGSSASESTRTFPVEMQIPNPNGIIIEGVTAEMHLPIKEVLAHNVPPSVLSLLDNGQLSVKAVDENNKIIAYPVKILGDSANGIWLGGLPEKLLLVVVGNEYVVPNQEVIPVPMDAAEASP